MATPQFSGQLDLSLESARRIAMRRGHAFVGTEHVLLAFAMSGPESFARRLLDELDITVELRRRIEQVIGEDPSDPAAGEMGAEGFEPS